VTIILKGTIISLRTLRIRDSYSLYQNARHKDVGRYTMLPYPYRPKDALEYIKRSRTHLRRKKAYEFGITLRNNDQVIGMIGLMNLGYQNKNAELGFWLGKKYWHKGIMKEAIFLIIGFGFKKLRLARIYAKMMQPNIPSANLLKKLDFAC
jgi:RimJ/RimL family protein N-acetyltransferase